MKKILRFLWNICKITHHLYSQKERRQIRKSLKEVHFSNYFLSKIGPHDFFFFFFFFLKWISEILIKRRRNAYIYYFIKINTCRDIQVATSSRTKCNFWFFSQFFKRIWMPIQLILFKKSNFLRFIKVAFCSARGCKLNVATCIYGLIIFLLKP